MDGLALKSFRILDGERKFTSQYYDIFYTSITINVPVVYMAQDVMILMRAISITRAIGRGGL
jgi:hypothetical protein